MESREQRLEMLKETYRKKTEALTNPERGDSAPTLSIPESEMEAYMALEQSMQSGDTYAVVRCWGKDQSALEDFSKRMQAMQQEFPDLKGIVFAINDDGEKKNVVNGRTEDPDFTMNALHALRESGSVDMPFVGVSVQNYDWTAGLNMPAALLEKSATEKGVDSAQVSVLNMSFETEVGDVAQLAQQMKETGHTLSVKNGEYITDLDTFAAEVGAVLNAVETTDLPTETPYIGRNTLAAFTLKEIKDLGGFNPACNTMGGMEDQEFWLRLLLKIGEEQGKGLQRMMNEEEGSTPDAYYLELGEKLMTLFNTDVVSYTAGGRLSEDEELKKLERERGAIHQIIADFSKKRLHENQGAAIAEEQQDARFTA